MLFRSVLGERGLEDGALVRGARAVVERALVVASRAVVEERVAVAASRDEEGATWGVLEYDQGERRLED